jgi:hypothetical protein
MRRSTPAWMNRRKIFFDVAAFVELTSLNDRSTTLLSDSARQLNERVRYLDAVHISVLLDKAAFL